MIKWIISLLAILAMAFTARAQGVCTGTVIDLTSGGSEYTLRIDVGGDTCDTYFVKDTSEASQVYYNVIDAVLSNGYDNDVTVTFGVNSKVNIIDIEPANITRSASYWVARSKTICTIWPGYNSVYRVRGVDAGMVMFYFKGYAPNKPYHRIYGVHDSTSIGYRGFREPLDCDIDYSGPCSVPYNMDPKSVEYNPYRATIELME